MISDSDIDKLITAYKMRDFRFIHGIGPDDVLEALKELKLYREKVRELKTELETSLTCVNSVIEDLR